MVRDGGLWRDIRVVAETGSTNADVVALARAGEPEGLVLIAEAQSAGRGRLGRTWTAPPRSGLFFSLLLRPGSNGDDVPTSRWGWLPLLAGTAVRTAVERVSEVPVKLKWPNDLVVPSENPADDTAYGAGRKLGGILVERVDSPAGPAAVVGIGLNVSLRSDELPAPHATSLALAGAASADRDPVLRAVLREIERWYGDWTTAAGDPEASGLASAYSASCATLGRHVRMELPSGETVAGEAVSVDGDGCLILRTPAGDRVFSAGDVIHLRW
jgi:BirA family transcriptional regulator, biotin operon repressor / biotin---[acetyl-CoA-carboxylase] ligase